MCGISGIIYKNRQADYKDIKAMNGLIIHRGPDAEGFYLDGSLALGHRRLSILDLSNEANQPMIFKNYIIVFNGEIYNYIELKEELIKLGYTFKTKCDTEIILAAYDCWGEFCVNRFNGMWAFALYDRKKQILFCSRDRYGVKPFYYSCLNDKFIFGSEIKQLLYFLPYRTADKEILADYIVCSLSEHTEKTFFKNVFNLRGGHNLIFDINKNKYKIYSYYRINNNRENSGKDYKKSFLQSIKYRLRSDVKVGTCLSGGLDSSSVAAVASDLLKKKGNTNFVGIHAKSTETKTDESFYAKLAAKSNDIDLKLVIPSKEDFLNNIDEVCYAQEEPFPSLSIIMQYFAMKEAKKHNCKVMLDGQGGDETLLGYERYYPLCLLSMPLKSAFINLIKSAENSKLSFWRLIGYCLYFICFPLRIMRYKLEYSFLKQDYLPDFKWVKRSAKAYFSISKLQKLEIFNTQLPHLLRYEDKNSMRNSIETRLPFLDYKLLELSLSLNNDSKIHDGWTKYILRVIMNNYLPDKILWRKNKLGFEAPENDWLSAIRLNMVNNIKNNKLIMKMLKDNTKIERLNNKILWKLFSVSKWIELFSITDIN